MAVVSCKMCGGDIELQPNTYTGVCPYCGVESTFPKLDSSMLETLYQRAEQNRRNCNFDQAVSCYEKIVEVNPNDPEAYWGIVISRFGIEYVEDPSTGERIPTCHRIQYQSILEDDDYKETLEHADEEQRRIYEAAAVRIDALLQDFLQISREEGDYDIFICYKESDADGNRTPDSHIAEEFYDNLTARGYRVFFARITLEEKLGSQYEPIIFAALNSARMMLVIGTRKEHFEAVWVRNEWRRYLDLIRHDRSKTLVPCFRDMEGKELPRELGGIQAQDLSKFGAVKEICRRIEVTMPKEVEQAAEPAPAASGKNNPLIIRAFLEIQQGDFAKAETCIDKLLDTEPMNGWAYFIKMMYQNQVVNSDDLARLYGIVDTNAFLLAEYYSADDPELAGLIQKLRRDYEANLPELQAAYEQMMAEENARRLEAEAQQQEETVEAKQPKEIVYSSGDGMHWVLKMLLSILCFGIAWGISRLFDNWIADWIIAPFVAIFGIYISQYVFSAIIFAGFGVMLAFYSSDVTSITGKIISALAMGGLALWSFSKRDDEASNPIVFVICAIIGLALFNFQAWWVRGLIAPIVVFCGTVYDNGD